MSKGKVNELIYGAVRKMVGPALKVGVRPETYDLAQHAKGVRKAGLGKIVASIIKNKNTYKPSYPGRETLWAGATGQKVSKKLRKTERKAMDVFTDKKGKITHFGLKPGSRGMDEVALNVAEQKGIVSRSKKLLHNIPRTVETTKNHSVMGGYNLKVPPKGKGAATYQDTWDFAINKNEKLTHYLSADKLEKVIKPNKTTRAIDKVIGQTEKLEKKIGPSKALSKVKSGLDVAKVVAQPESVGFAVNKARNVLDKVVKKYEIKGELIAPKGTKILTPTENAKHLENYTKIKKKKKFEKGIAETPFMYDALLRSGAMKPYSKYVGPTKVVVKDIKKSKFFGMPVSPKKLIQDVKETKWEHTRAINTLAKNKVVKGTKKQRSIAKRNVAVLGTQATVAAAAVGTGVDALLPKEKKQNKK